MDNLTLWLSRRVHELGQTPVAGEVVEAASSRLLDSIACAFGAFDADFCQRMRLALGHPEVPGGISAWGTQQPTTAENAAFASAIMVRYLDLNDTVLGLTGGHPSDMIAALVALSEERKASGPDLLRSIVIAYELYCGLCQGVRLAEVGLDQAIAASIGTAGASAFLMGLDEERTAHAISIAACSNAALFNVRMGELSEWKACAGPNASARGLASARLAAAGVTGPSGIFTGEGGLTSITGPIAWPENGQPLILLTHLKLHPVCYHGQSAVDAAIFIREKLNGRSIQKVSVEVNRTAHYVMGNDPTRWRPSTRETADHSIPYCVAVALLRGAVVSADFVADRLSDPQTLQMADCISVAEDPAFTAGDPNNSPARLTVELADGERLIEEVTHARGHARNPLTRGGLMAKLDALWPQSRPLKQKTEIMEAVAALPSAPSLEGLVRALNQIG